MRNLKKFYYKDYFKNIDFSPILGKSKSKGSNIIRDNNRILCNTSLDAVIPKNDMVNITMELKVAYPGLVTGVGINHEANIEGEFKLGIHFDHTHGQPVIYGSTVKGVLRHYMEEENYSRALIDDIFEGKKSIYERDIFFDAVIKKANTSGKILASDSITPHGKNPLKNPIPLTFVKIASGCTLEFRFRLVDSVIDGKTVTAEDKKQIFSGILTTYGVGAKTNVGYGQLESVE